MNISWKKDLFPHIGAILIFIIVPLLYCSPVLEGKVVNQGDMIQVEGMTKEAKDFYAKTGEHPLWSNSMFSGMPTYMTFTGPSSNKIAYVNRLMTLYLPAPVNMLFLAMLGFYLLLTVLGYNYWIRILGAIAFGFSSYNLIIIGVGHVTKMMCMAYMAPLLAGVILTYRGRYLTGGALTALMAALMIYNNHLQITYYTLLMLACLAIGQLITAIKQKTLPDYLKATLVLVIAGLLAVLPAADNLLITKEYTNYSMRGSQSELTLNKTAPSQKSSGLDIDYAYRWSYGKMETFTLLIPNLYGGSSHGSLSTGSKTYETLTQLGMPPTQAEQIIKALPLYWGPQPVTSGPVYFGAVICFLFVLALFLIQSWEKWWMLVAIVMAVVMAWGSNFPVINHFLFYHLPYYNKFRAPSMILVIPQVLFVWMACWALQEVLKKNISKQVLLNSLKKSFYITGGILVVLGMLGAMFFDFKSATDQQIFGNEQLIKAIQEDRASMLRMDALRNLVLVGIAAAAIWAFLKEQLKARLLVAIVVSIVAIDMITVGKRYLKDDDFVEPIQYDAAFQPTAIDQQILQDKDPYYRVMNLTSDTFNEAITSYHHKSIGGYSPAKLWIYQDLIDHQISKNNMAVLNMLNTKYFIVPGQNGQAQLQRNPDALGNAWFVKSIHWVPDANSEMLALNHFNPRDTVVIDKRFQAEVGTIEPRADAKAQVKLTQYGLNELHYQSSNANLGLAVFSDIYYPAGWKAFIDGKETPILRVNYALRGLKIPAGQHQIVFKFHPDTYFTGQKISLISSLTLILLVAGALATALLRKKNPAVG